MKGTGFPMSRSVKVWHNPRCSKSRLALQYLESKGCKVEVFEYLKIPPQRAEIEEVVALLGVNLKSVLRRGEAAFKDLNLGAEETTSEELLNAVLSNPILIERPIVVHGNKAIVARPTERIDEIL
jgi:arsenate reductase